MKMIAASRLRRAQEAIVSTRPYARKLGELLRHLVTKIDPSLNPLLIAREVKSVLLVVVTGDRGLCGSFNSNVIKSAVQHLQTQKDVDVRVLTIGKKGTDYFAKRDYNIVAKHSGIFQALDFSHARSVVDEISRGYLRGDFDRVEVIYNEFKSVIRQRVVIEPLLPIPPEETRPINDLRALAQIDYIYEPSSEETVNALIPRHLNFQLWRVLLESNAAAQGAQMTAMDNATENASELIQELTLKFNNARQASITKELLEVVSGAEALTKAD
jgi:F-type H+-transporting ATPase subunit gamma